MIRKILWWLSYVFGTALALPVVGRFAEGYAEGAGWLDDPKGSVDQWWSQAILFLSWFSKQWWYTHGVTAIVALGLGYYLATLIRRPKVVAPSDYQGTPSPVKSPSEALLDAMLKTNKALAHVIGYADQRLADESDYVPSEGEWRALEVLLRREGFSIPLPIGKSSEKKARERQAYIQRLLPLVRGNHMPEAVAESKVLLQ